MEMFPFLNDLVQHLVVTAKSKTNPFAIFLHSYKEQACFIALTDPVNEAICCHVLLHFY